MFDHFWTQEQREHEGAEPRIDQRSCGDTPLTMLCGKALGSIRRHRRAITPDQSERMAEQLHEVRATVAGIVLSHRMLQEHRDDLAEPDHDRLEHLRDAELSRLERLLITDPEQRVSSVVLDDVLSPVVDVLRLRGHEVRWSGTPCRVLGRPDEVAEIVHILLENAARHAPGCRIDVAVEHRGAWVDLRVTDHGPGVAPTVLSSLFERGTRGPDSPGSGLGLHLARRLSMEMKGRLRLDRSAAGSGATFVLTLPAGPAAHPPVAEPQSLNTQAS